MKTSTGHVANTTLEIPYMKKELRISRLKEGNTEILLKKELIADVSYDNEENL